jgi:hypothetical protein
MANKNPVPPLPKLPPKPPGIDFEFDNLLAAAVVSVIIKKRPRKRRFPVTRSF